MGKRIRNSYLKIAEELGYTEKYPFVIQLLMDAKDEHAAIRIMHDCRCGAINTINHGARR